MNIDDVFRSIGRVIVGFTANNKSVVIIHSKIKTRHGIDSRINILCNKLVISLKETNRFVACAIRKRTEQNFIA